MAESSRGLTHARLLWTAEWHIRDKTYAAALVDYHHAHPLNRLGELRDRTFENQRHRASGLNLIVSAIILWNTVYLDRAARHLREHGIDVPDALLAHVAPLDWERISLTGDYLWSEIEKPRERFRPLRTTGLVIRP